MALVILYPTWIFISLNSLRGAKSVSAAFGFSGRLNEHLFIYSFILTDRLLEHGRERNRNEKNADCFAIVCNFIFLIWIKKIYEYQNVPLNAKLWKYDF